MKTFETIYPKNEKELHSRIEKELDALEEGLVLLKYEYALPGGIPDFLCVDSGGRLVIIEVKSYEDENILFQALRYYNEVDKIKHYIKETFSEKNIVINSEDPRIILIAGNFSDDIKRLSTLVIPEIELYEYRLLRTQDGIEGIFYHFIPLAKEEVLPSKPKTIEEIKSYMTENGLKPLFDKILKEIPALGENIETYTRREYVGFKYKGRQIAYLWPHRKSFDFSVPTIDEHGHTIENVPVRIECGNEDYSEVMQRLKNSFCNIGGKLK